MSVDNKIIIGITGLIGDGKTELAYFFRNKGIKVIDVDNFAHNIYKRGMPLYYKLIKIYGKDILNSKGMINRNTISKIIFQNDFEYKKFISFIYPVLNYELKKYIKKLNYKMVVVDMAVLFQSSFYRFVDKIILVKTPEKIWENRFKNNKNYEIILKIRKLQKKQLKKFKTIALSNFILYNNRGKKKFAEKAKKIIDKIIKEGIYDRKRQ